MQITDPMIVPSDTVILSVSELPEKTRRQLTYEEGDCVIARPGARTPSQIVNADAARLLGEFRRPARIVDAVLRLSQNTQSNPEAMLEAAYPLLLRLMDAGVLVPADSGAEGARRPSFVTGDTVADVQILRCVQSLEDSELYAAQRDGGSRAALKILRSGQRPVVVEMLAREAAILRHLDGAAGPKLIAEGAFEGRPYLVMEWIEGPTALDAASQLRRLPGAQARRRLLDLARAILASYVELHERGVIHSDVHPRNMILRQDGTVAVIDFGLSRLTTAWDGLCSAPRAVAGYFYEPELALAMLGEKPTPQASFHGEQYVLGAVLYTLIAGAAYLELSPEKEEMARRIVRSPILPFFRHGIPAWPEMEEILLRALAKEPGHRFPSLAHFAEALSAVAVPDLPEFDSAASGGSLEALRRIRDEAVRCLKPGDVLFRAPLPSPSASLNCGAAGIAYALYRMASLREEPQLLALATAWCHKAEREARGAAGLYNRDLGLTEERISPASPQNGVAGIHLVQALIGHAEGNARLQLYGLDGFLAACRTPGAKTDLTLGRSGSLLASATLLETLGGQPETDPLRELGDRLMAELWDEVGRCPPIPDCREPTGSEEPWSGARTGMAHGWAGLIYATLRWCEAASSPLPDVLPVRLEELAAVAEPAGQGVRWPLVLGRAEESEQGFPASWCNGTAGQVLLWTLAYRRLCEESHRTLAERAALYTGEAVGDIGNLCCGLIGRAYGLLALYRESGELEWLRKAWEIANRAATRGLFPMTQYRHSLFQGELGLALLIEDLERPDLACFPSIESEGWTLQAHPELNIQKEKT
jgi:serine/threonine-protein kinase